MCVTRPRWLNIICNAITCPCPNFNNSFFATRRGWIITFHHIIWMWLLTHALPNLFECLASFCWELDGAWSTWRKWYINSFLHQSHCQAFVWEINLSTVGIRLGTQIGAPACRCHCAGLSSRNYNRKSKIQPLSSNCHRCQTAGTPTASNTSLRCRGKPTPL